MTIDRRLRSGEAPDAAAVCTWLLASACIALAAVMWPPSAWSGTAAELALPIASKVLALAAVIFPLNRMAWRLLGREAAIAACLVLPLNPLVQAAFRPGADLAASWQMAAAMLAIVCLSLRREKAGAALAGAVLAAGCGLGPAVWPLAGMLAVLLLFRWLRDHRAAAEFTAFLKAFAAVSLPLLLVQHWLGGGVACGVPHAGAGAGLAILLAGAMALERVPRLSPAMLASAMGTVAALAVTGALLVPALCSGAAAGLNPMPTLLENGFAFVPVIVGFGAALYLWRSNEAWLRRWWRDYTCVLGVAILGALAVPGTVTIAAVLAAMPLGWLAAQLLFGGRTARRTTWRPAMLAAVLVTGGLVFTEARSQPDHTAGEAMIAYATGVTR